MKDMKKTILRLGLLAASAFAGLSAAVAGDSVKYIVYDENGKSTEMTATDCEQLTGDNKAKDLEHKKWYYVKGNVTYDGTLNLGSGTAHADVHIILCDGAKLTVKGSGGHAAISVRYGTLHDDYLYIYGQKHQTGPYAVWQVAGCVLSWIVLVWFGVRVLRPFLLTAALPVGFTAAWILTAALTDDSGLWAVGAVLVAGGTVAGNAALVWVLRAFARRNHAGSAAP